MSDIDAEEFDQVTLLGRDSGEEITPEELNVSVTVDADLDLPEELHGEIGPGIGMAPEGFGSGGKWTSSARLERILGPGEDPEHPRFYNIVNGKITGIVVR